MELRIITDPSLLSLSCKEQGRVFVWSFQVWQFVVSGYRRNMGYLRVDCRASVFTLLDTLPCPYPVGDSSLSLPCGGLFLVPTRWGTLPCSLPCCGTGNQRHENHLYVDCPGVGQVARGIRTITSTFLRRIVPPPGVCTVLCLSWTPFCDYLQLWLCYICGCSSEPVVLPSRGCLMAPPRFFLTFICIRSMHFVSIEMSSEIGYNSLFLW